MKVAIQRSFEGPVERLRGSFFKVLCFCPTHDQRPWQWWYAWGPSALRAARPSAATQDAVEHSDGECL